MSLLEYIPSLCIGLLETLAIAGSALFLGLCLGVLFTIGSSSHYLFLRFITTGLCHLISALPELFVLFAIYFGGSALLSLLWHQPSTLNSFMASILALSIIFGSLASQILHANTLNIRLGEKEAAYNLGLNTKQIWRYILLPQIFQKSLPGLHNLWLTLLKDTAIVSLIGTTDLLSRTQFAITHTGQPFLFYTVLALIYLTLTLCSEMGLKRITV